MYVLTPGVRVGPYTILALVGQGGMGEVYRAHDSRLKRDVALKVLPATFADDPDRLARFEREAQVLASLNHPHIAQIHGLEESNGIRALVMEFVEGPTLAERIAQGPLPVDEALPVARQIAEALETAHEAGIIHRDLKPSNIKLRLDGTVKVLDFGLAKATESSASPAALANSPTFTSPAAMTHAGVILGTAPYMAPEQARGRALDRRADVWAFGCVLYEMLTGRPAFAGADVPDTLASVLRAEPDYTRLPQDATSFRPLLERCLQKDPAGRLAHMSVVRFLLDAPLRPEETRPVPAKKNRARQAVVATIVVSALVVFATIGARRWSSGVVTTSDMPLDRVSLVLPAGVSTIGHTPLAVANDGSTVVFAGVPSGRTTPTRLYLRRRDSLDASAIDGTDGALEPTLDPSGTWIAYRGGNTLRRVPVAGGASVALCDMTHPHGVAWSSTGRIYFAPDQGQDGIWVVDEAGGIPSRVTTIDRETEGAHEYPTALPDGRGLIFNVLPPDGDHTKSKVVVFDVATGQTRLLVESGFAPKLSRDYLVFARGDALYAGRFDVGARQITGQIVRVVDRVFTRTNNGTTHYAVALSADVMVYQPGANLSARSLIWTAPEGEDRPAFSVSQMFSEADLSPDATRVAALVNVSTIGPTQIWTGDPRRGGLSRFLTPGGQLASLRWAPDSHRFAFAQPLSGEVRVADLTGHSEVVLQGQRVTHVAWTPDGGSLLLTVSRPRTGTDVALFNLKTRTLTMLLESEVNEGDAELSPDGRYLAYTRQGDVEVRPYPSRGAAIVVSTGLSPRWSRDGKSLFFYDSAGNIMRSEFNGVSATVPEQAAPTIGVRQPFGLSADGKFLRIAELTNTTGDPLVAVRGFSRLLRTADAAAR